jgi:hypothetical protein
MKDCIKMKCNYYDESFPLNCSYAHLDSTEHCKHYLTTEQTPRAEVPLDCGVSPVVSKVQLRGMVLDWHKNVCHIPAYWDNVIAEIVDAHLHSLSVSLGNLELCVRRTLSHTEEIRENMPKQEKKG